MNLPSNVKMDKTAICVTSLKENDERDYWHLKTPEERLAAMELMRQINYGYNPLTDRLQKVYTIIKRT